jgi:AcrR family transcriptional regulator
MTSKIPKTHISDHQSKILTDHESEIKSARRGRPSVPVENVLLAANKLFAEAESPASVTMDAIAAAANVGKGTLFRAFGSRDGLLDTLWAEKLLVLRTATTGSKSPLGPHMPASERPIAFLDAVLTFKLENRHLIHARESASAGLRQSDHYKWMHTSLEKMIHDATDGAVPDAGYSAHVLLNALHIDLIEELLASGRSIRKIRKNQAALVRAIIGEANRQ